jgi:hypothetical protein
MQVFGIDKGAVAVEDEEGGGVHSQIYLYFILKNDIFEGVNYPEG